MVCDPSLTLPEGHSDVSGPQWAVDVQRELTPAWLHGVSAVAVWCGLAGQVPRGRGCQGRGQNSLIARGVGIFGCQGPRMAPWFRGLVAHCLGLCAVVPISALPE
ncbi:hypothetical protein BaRGS_00033584 [Batillaria attramentaria]|uniref:Uncharacterized protein n=1 Tax=Batillaria attramentaria TaxID=370345 RepID=A0ABD0JKC1_9CAEN